MHTPPSTRDESPEHPGLRDRVAAFMAGAGGQFVRYAITGFSITAVAAAIYWIIATWGGVAPLVANLVGYAVAVTLGYIVHSRWSFRGHGRRDNAARTTSRFFAASLISLGLNSLWVWILTGLLHGPTWWPIVPIMAVTPVAMFWLNRVWVFG